MAEPLTSEYADIPGYRSEDSPPCRCPQCRPGPGVDFRTRYNQALQRYWDIQDVLGRMNETGR